MLFALGTPLCFLILAVGFVLAVTVQGVVTTVVASVLGDRGPRLEARHRFDPRRQVDPFGLVAAAIGGLGWSRPVELTRLRMRSKARYLLALLAGPVVVVGLGCAAIEGYLLLGGSRAALGFLSPARDVLLGFALPQRPDPAVVVLLIGIALLSVGMLAFVPIPPLPGGEVLFTLAGSSPGWRRVHYTLGEENWGILVLLVLVALPVAGRLPVLMVFFDAAAGALARAFS